MMLAPDHKEIYFLAELAVRTPWLNLDKELFTGLPMLDHLSTCHPHDELPTYETISAEIDATFHAIFVSRVLILSGFPEKKK